MSLGEDRVRIKFNPEDRELVSQLKQKTAELIDMCDKAADVSGQNPELRGEIHRLWSLAMTAYEEAAMWAVKAATS